MMTRGRLIFISLSLGTVFLLATATFLAANERQKDDGSDSLYKYLSVFTEVFGLVDRAYVDQQDPGALMAGAFEGTLDALDPFAMFVGQDRLETYETLRQVGDRHSGLVVLKERGVAYILAVAPGSPAEKAGLEPQQIIAAIDGRRTRLMPLLEIQAAFTAPSGTAVELERLDQGQKDELVLTLGEYPPPALELRAERGVPVLRIPRFDTTTTSDVETSLRTLASEVPGVPGAEHHDLLLLDVRGTAGGEATAAYGTAGLFVRGELGSLLRRGEAMEGFDSDREPLWAGRMAILVDRGTQGPAEILTQILRQSAEAELVGEDSFGHAGSTALIRLSSGDRIQLTEAFYTGPDQQPIREALEPDLRVRRPFGDEEDPTRDEILEQGLDHLLAPPVEEEEERLAA